MFSTRATERIAGLERQIGALEASVQFLQATVNQLQQERSVLLERVLGIQIAAPTIVQSPGIRPPQPTRPRDDAADPFSLMNHFEDMGDEAAAREGIDLTPDGFLAQR